MCKYFFQVLTVYGEIFIFPLRSLWAFHTCERVKQFPHLTLPLALSNNHDMCNMSPDVAFYVALLLSTSVTRRNRQVSVKVAYKWFH